MKQTDLKSMLSILVHNTNNAPVNPMEAVWFKPEIYYYPTDDQLKIIAANVKAKRYAHNLLLKRIFSEKDKGNIIPLTYYVELYFEMLENKDEDIKDIPKDSISLTEYMKSEAVFSDNIFYAFAGAESLYNTFGDNAKETLYNGTFIISSSHIIDFDKNHLCISNEDSKIKLKTQNIDNLSIYNNASLIKFHIKCNDMQYLHDLKDAECTFQIGVPCKPKQKIKKTISPEIVVKECVEF